MDRGISVNTVELKGHRLGTGIASPQINNLVALEQVEAVEWPQRVALKTVSLSSKMPLGQRVSSSEHFPRENNSSSSFSLQRFRAEIGPSRGESFGPQASYT